MKSVNKKLKPPVRPDSAPPFQKWCEKDFVADTIHMHWLARIFYARLLQIAFSTSPHRPNIKASNAAICKLLGNVPLDVWQEHQSEVLEMFQQTEVNGIPVLSQSRLQRDYEVLQDYRFSQSKISKEYWDGVRKERRGLEGATQNPPTPIGKGFGIPSVQGPVSQDDVDFDSDIYVENYGEVEIVPPKPRSSSQPSFKPKSEDPVINEMEKLWHHWKDKVLDLTGQELVSELVQQYGKDRVIDVWAWYCQSPLSHHFPDSMYSMEPDQVLTEFWDRFASYHDQMSEEQDKEVEAICLLEDAITASEKESTT